jgi:hypothetical protein
MNSMSPEEVVPYFYPQIYSISNPALSEEEFPPVSVPRLANYFDCAVGNTLERVADSPPNLPMLRCHPRLHYGG